MQTYSKSERITYLIIILQFKWKKEYHSLIVCTFGSTHNSNLFCKLYKRYSKDRGELLVACTRLYTPTYPSVCRSVGRLVGCSFYFFYIFFTSLLLPKWSSDLKYGPCPPTRDLGSRVSGLVLFIYSFMKIFHFEVKNGME